MKPDKIIIESHMSFDRLVSYIQRLETVSSEECDRCHNQKKNTRAIMPIAKLCKKCQKELRLNEQVAQ